MFHHCPIPDAVRACAESSLKGRLQGTMFHYGNLNGKLIIDNNPATVYEITFSKSEREGVLDLAGDCNADALHTHFNG